VKQRAAALSNCFKTIVVLLSLFDENHNELPISSFDCAPDAPVTA
jgi:hypothetical protein